MIDQDRQEFSLAFDSAGEIDRAFDRKGEESGFFFQGEQKVPVGRRACIRLEFEGFKTPLYLEGTVAWRRVRAGGPDMPVGVFVNLDARDRLRVDGLIRYLGSGSKAKERRRTQRYPFFASAVYRTAKGKFRSEIRDISKGGAFLRCTGPLLSMGATFPVTLYLEGDSDRGVEVDAQVAWLEMFDDPKGMGVVFRRGRSALKNVARTIKRIEQDLKRLAE